jgi:hypothetical protein
VSIKVRDVRGRYNFTQMGMVDRRTGGPNVLWGLLLRFAEGRGYFGWDRSEAGPEKQKRKEELAKSLRRFFSISGDPIEVFDDHSTLSKSGKPTRAWKTRFQVSQGD